MKFLIVVRDGLSNLNQELSEVDEMPFVQCALPLSEFDSEIPMSLLGHRIRAVPEQHGINLCMRPGFNYDQSVVYQRLEQWPFFRQGWKCSRFVWMKAKI
ncbi:MAG: hypothetical protein OXF54_17575 [Caldilineaceae bacterium]|nr:hypothetical protein [Caldilineaceae bacterium]